LALQISFKSLKATWASSARAYQSYANHSALSSLDCSVPCRLRSDPDHTTTVKDTRTNTACRISRMVRREAARGLGTTSPSMGPTSSSRRRPRSPTNLVLYTTLGSILNTVVEERLSAPTGRMLSGRTPAIRFKSDEATTESRKNVKSRSLIVSHRSLSALRLKYMPGFGHFELASSGMQRSAMLYHKGSSHWTACNRRIACNQVQFLILY